MSLVYLWRERERPMGLSRRWLVVWIKRALTAIPLLQLAWRRSWLRVRGARIGSLAVIEPCVLIGRRALLTVGAESFIGARSTLMLHQRLTIGSRVVISSGVTILTAGHSLNEPGWSSQARPVTIDDYAWIATGAVLLPGVHVGRGAVVGAGAVVRRDVADGVVVIGNPAEPIRAVRCARLDYSPVALCAPHEAWLGRRSETSAGR